MNPCGDTRCLHHTTARDGGRILYCMLICRMSLFGSVSRMLMERLGAFLGRFETKVVEVVGNGMTF